MPLRDDLLNPIPGYNPSGVSLRYERIYDQIKEARTEDDESIPVGAWQRQAKKADFKAVINLAGESLASKSKDLQLAAWLAEAHIKREGLGLIQPCFKLIQELQEQFWETLYPEIEDNDAGMRAMPIEWMANRVAALVREAPITKSGMNYYQYKESRTVGYEADAESSDSKREARKQAIEDGKVTGEDFDASFTATSKAFYVDLQSSVKSTMETLESVREFCDRKYGDDGPGFSKLNTSLEEVGQVINSLLNEKRTLEPDLVEGEAAEEEQQEESDPEAVAEEAVESAVASRKKDKAIFAEPESWDDAVRRIQACVQFMQKECSSSPVPYLLQTAVRFGEMREQGSPPSYDFLVSPSTEVRQNLKRLSAESNWEELLRIALITAGEPCGRAWLDVQRYIWKASNEAGHYSIASTVIAALQSLLKDIPELHTWTLDDDTPVANPETQRWLEEMVIPAPTASEVQHEEAQSVQAEAYSSQSVLSGEEAEEAIPDAFDLARDMIRRGQLSPAIQLLVRDAAQRAGLEIPSPIITVISAGGETFSAARRLSGTIPADGGD